MNTILKKYNILLQLLLIILSVGWITGLNKIYEVRASLYILTFVFILFTFILSYYSNKKQKVYSKYNLMIVYTILVIVAFVIKNNGIEFSYLISMISMVIFPLCLIIANELKVSDRVYGLITVIAGISALFNFGNEVFIREFSYVLIPLSFILVFCERNYFIKMLYVFSNAILLDQLMGKLYLTIFFVLIELAISVKDEDDSKYGIEIVYLLIYLLSIVIIVLKYIEPLVPITILIATLANKGFIKEKKNLVFTAYDLSVGGIETSLVNLLNDVNYNKYNVNLLLEKKDGELLDRINKKVYVQEYKVYDFKNKKISKAFNFIKRSIYSLFNYHIYDFSCCYATYSYCGNKLAKITSANSTIYVHGNYKYIYKERKLKEFFNSRKLDEFRKIIFVSNESMNDYLELYEENEDKVMVINNFIDVDRVIKKSKEKIDIEKPKKGKLLVYVGRLEEESKKITRILEIAKEIDKVNVWIIGDGKDREMYEKIIKKDNLESRVKMLGSIAEPYSYMNKADYVILTSDYEGFPVVYLEALALNKEIITTINVSDERINMKERANIISKDNYVEEVREIVSKVKDNNEEINLKEIQKERKIKLESLFEGVI